MQQQCDITVSIVSYNTRDLLRACLQSLLARQSEGEATLQIIVADNGSTDGSIAMVESAFPEAEALATGGNLGYGRANNLAFAKARGRYFFALNSDTEVEPGTLRTMRDFMDAHPEAGAAGAQLVWPNGDPQTSYGNDPELLNIFLEQTYLDKLLSRLMSIKSSHEEKPHSNTGDILARDSSDTQDEPREVEQICGACQFVRSAAYRQIGGYDPAYFMYHEDVDLNIRLRRAGWRIFFLPAARIRHHLGASSEKDWRTRARMVSSLNWSRYYYFSRHGGPLRGHLLKSMFVLGAGLRLLGWSYVALARPSALEKVKLFREVWRQAWRMTT